MLLMAIQQEKLKRTSPRGSQLDSIGDQITMAAGLVGLFYFELDFIKKNIILILVAFTPYLIQMEITYAR